MKRRILGFALLSALSLAGATRAFAGTEPVCAAPSELTRAGFSLPRLARSLAQKTPTTILVLNSSAAKKTAADKPASVAAAKDAVPRGFPGTIEELMRARYPDGEVVVTTNSQPRATAETIIATLPEVLAEAKPALMIWHTGTYDAILAADTSSFSDAVLRGIEMAHEAGADVIVVSPQYSPRTAFAFDVAPYTSALRWTARAGHVPFFDRYDVMRFWETEGIFDFDSVRPSPSLYEDVHRCIGRLLVGMIVDGVDSRTLGSR